MGVLMTHQRFRSENGNRGQMEVRREETKTVDSCGKGSFLADTSGAAASLPRRTILWCNLPRLILSRSLVHCFDLMRPMRRDHCCRGPDNMCSSARHRRFLGSRIELNSFSLHSTSCCLTSGTLTFSIPSSLTSFAPPT